MGFFHRHEIDEVMGYLRKAERCPPLVVDNQFHCKMTMEHWREVVTMPVITVHVDLGVITLNDLKEYIDLAKTIKPQSRGGGLPPRPPDFILHNGDLTPDHLHRFRHVNLVQINLSAFSWKTHGLFEYLNVLERNGQFPELHLNEEGFAMGNRELRRVLKQFRVPVMHTFGLSIFTRRRIDERKLVDTIINGHKTNNPVRSILDYDEGFNKGSRKRLKEAGIEIYEMRRHSGYSSTGTGTDDEHIDDSDG